MKNTKYPAIVILLVLAIVAVVGCAPPGGAAEQVEPTITAIPLPTRMPIEEAGVAARDDQGSVERTSVETTSAETPESMESLAAAPLVSDISPTETLVPAATPSLEPTLVTAAEPTPTPAAIAALSALPAAETETNDEKAESEEEAAQTAVVRKEPASESQEDTAGPSGDDLTLETFESAVQSAVWDQTGSGPDDALRPSGEWIQLGADESVWYAFTYAGDGSQIRVQLQVEPSEGVTFVVWTPEQIWRWSLGEYVEPIGRGSADPSAAGKLLWTGNFGTAGTYYVVVQATGSHAGTSYYLLDVSGSGVSSLEPAPTSSSEPAKVQTQAQVAPPGDPSGTLVFQTTYGGPFYTIHVDGTDLQRITHGIDPVWSPSGKQIAFVRWEEPRGAWVVDAETGNEWRVFDWSETRYPSWSPDGEQIVFARQYGVVPSGPRPSRPKPPPGSGESAGQEMSVLGWPGGAGGGRGGNPPGSATWNLGIVDVRDGSYFEPQPDSDVNLAPAWSPDGAPEGAPEGGRIVYDAVHGLRIMSVDGKTSYALTEDPNDTNPVWSPDGGQVAYIHRQHDHWEIYVVDVNTGQQTRLTDTPARPDGAPSLDGVAAHSVSPAWSPDGNYIAFLTDRTGEWEIWIMETNGSNPRSLFGNELDGLMLDYAFAGERAISWTE